jgi:hypothetical protein
MRGLAASRACVIPAVVVTVASAAALIYAANPPTPAVTNDFYLESWPAYAALLHGHPVAFLQLGPAYVGSLVLRAPVAVIPGLLGGGWRAVYFASAVPCALGAAAFCTWLVGRPGRHPRSAWGGRAISAVLCISNPLVVIALLKGHPEDVLGGALCAAAVILAIDARAGWAILVTVLAVVNKPWGLLAVPVVLVALPRGRWLAAVMIAGAAGAILIPVMALHDSGFSPAAAGASIGTIFHAPQLLWWFGPYSWVARLARAEIVAIGLASVALWSVRRSRGAHRGSTEAEPLLLLALVMLLRAALDPWNTLYYQVPFLFALMAYERRLGKRPVLTGIYTVTLLIVVPVRNIPPTSPDLRAALFTATALVTIGWLTALLYLPATALKRPIPGVARLRRSSRDQVTPA